MIGTSILLRAVADGRIALHISQPETACRFKAWAKTTARRPSVALIGDDDYLERGAKAWGGYAFRIARWASHVMVHAAGAEPDHYEGAVRAAEGGARVLAIDTCPASAPSWPRSRPARRSSFGRKTASIRCVRTEAGHTDVQAR